MASKTQQQLSTIRALMMDCLGNAASGNALRAAGYAHYALQALEAHMQYMDTKHPRYEKEFHAVSPALFAEQDSGKWPPIEMHEEIFLDATKRGWTAMLGKVRQTADDSEDDVAD